MVKVREIHPLHGDTDIDLEHWMDRVVARAPISPDARDDLRRALEMSMAAEKRAIAEHNTWGQGASSFLTGLEMAEILAELNMDLEGLQAAILYRAVREGKLSHDQVEKTFGPGVAGLIDSVLRMAVISTLRNDSEHGVFGHGAKQQAAKVREMLVSIIDDVRVALIKLAERTCAIRAVKNAPAEKRIRVAREVFDVYAPLAHRLGIGHLKWELEDLAFRYLEPSEYKQIARLLDERRMDRQQYIQEVVKTLRSELYRNGIEGEVSGRAKHIYSIWKKMRRKEIGFSQVYDIRAVRILVPTVADCYTMLGIVHSKWRNIPNEFDDYIASPKENGYRSLHTAVIGPGRRVLEIQIRTFAMHQEAEFGVCAHWQYKGSDTSDAVQSYESKIAWLRQVLEWHEEIEEENVKELLRLDHSPDRIYAFTPDGHVVDLPYGATPLDFAYRIHTQIGHRCRGAKVNGRIVSLNTKLRTADQVEILTGKQEAPSRDWISPSLGFLHTARARSKVQQWFRNQAKESNIAAGKAMLERELKQLGLKQLDLKSLATKFNKRDADGLLAAVGAGDVGVNQVLNATYLQVEGGGPRPRRKAKKSPATRFGRSDFYIYGVGDLLTRIAGCCSPVPGDDICGYITHGRGATIHRKDCGNLLRLQSQEPERVLKVSWGGAPKKVYPAKLVVHAFDRNGLLRDITGVVDKQNVYILSLHSGETRNGKVETELTVEVQDIEQLSGLLSRLRQVPNVLDVQRINE